MGLFSSLLPIAGGFLGNTLLPGVGGALGSALGGALAGGSGSQQSGTTTSTTQQQIDPRLQSLLYVDGGSGNTGLLQQIAQQAQQGQSGGLKGFGAGIDSYLGGWGTNNFLSSQQAAQRLQDSQLGAPQAQNTNAANFGFSDAAKVQAPAQNNIDLTGSYNRFINGDAGANPYLTKSLQAGVDATNAGFNKNISTTTDALNNSLAGIRSNSVLAGQYGGSRQGIAEGNALKGYTQQLNDANSLLAAQNSANTTAAQAQAFNQGQDRALAATQGLGAQQYGVASQNAANQQQTALNNANNFQGAEIANAGLRQGVNLANLQAQLQTNGQNSQNQAAGIGLSSGLLGQAAQYGNQYANADWQKLLQGSGALAPYTGAGATQTQSSPYFTNGAANALSGATGALSLYNMLKGNSGSSGVPSSASYAANDWFTS